MSINTVQSTTPFDQIARQLVDRFDANKDGQLTTEEFTSFLSNFLTTTATPNASANGLVNGVANGVAAGAGANGLKLGTVKPNMDAFDSRKVADPGHLTVKYKFAKVAKQYSLESVTDKTKAEELLKQMKADLTAIGLNVLDISKDKIKIKDDAGQEAWYDVIRAAGSGHARGWQFSDTRS